MPLQRTLAELRGHGLDVPSGSIIGGLQKLVPLCESRRAGIEHNRVEGHWHCDETRWLVFVQQPDKANFCWMLWVFAAKESVVFVLDPTRAHDVPEGHFGDDGTGILNVDRYSAYKAMAQVKAGQMVLAFCWAHVRRDFLAVLTGWQDLVEWAWSWVEDIGELYQRNDVRLALNPGAPGGRLRRRRSTCVPARRDRAHACSLRARTGTPRFTFAAKQGAQEPGQALVRSDGLRGSSRSAAGQQHGGTRPAWSGRRTQELLRLRFAVERPPGPGAPGFSLFQTVQLWQMDVGRWLTAYLTACAQAHGQPPADPSRYLPWNLSADDRQRLRVPTSRPPDPQANPPPAQAPPADPSA